MLYGDHILNLFYLSCLLGAVGATIPILTRILKGDFYNFLQLEKIGIFKIRYNKNKKKERENSNITIH